MKYDFMPFIDYLLAFKFGSLVNIGELAAAVCYAIIFLRLKHGENGGMRPYLLWYFGTRGCGALLLAFVYHPHYNYWAFPFTHGVTLVPLLALTGYIIDRYWLQHREP